MNPDEAAGEGLSGRVTAEQGEEVVGEGQVAPGPQKGVWGPVVAEEHYWDPAKAADAARILAAHPPRDYTVATTIGQPDDCPNCNHPYLLNGCTCRPWTGQTNPPRYLDQPGDTVDMIGGYEVGADCPHHQPTGADAEPAGSTYTPSWTAGDTPLVASHRRTFRLDTAAQPVQQPSPAATLHAAADALRAGWGQYALQAALADWLDEEARRETYTLAEFGHRTASPNALTVARTILAEQPEPTA